MGVVLCRVVACQHSPTRSYLTRSVFDSESPIPSRHDSEWTEHRPNCGECADMARPWSTQFAAGGIADPTAWTLRRIGRLNLTLLRPVAVSFDHHPIWLYIKECLKNVSHFTGLRRVQGHVALKLIHKPDARRDEALLRE